MHTHIHTQEYYRGPVGCLSPATCVLSTVSPNCWRPRLLSFVLFGGAVLPVLTILHRGFGIVTSPCLQRTILYIEFSRHVLYTSPVWLLSVSCHSVHTNLFKVPCGCSTCKNFLFPSVMCPQCPVFRVLFHGSTLIFIVPPRRPHPGPAQVTLTVISGLFFSIKEDILSPWL